jgi:hypothetical protein
MAQPAARKMPPWKIAAIAAGVVLAIVVMVVGGLRSRPNEVYVYCEGKDEGVVCSVTHQEGYEPAGVCWDVKITCANRATLIGSGCQNVQPKGKVSLLLQESQFKGGTCDKATGFVVENVKVGPVKAQANSPVGTSAPAEQYLLIPQTNVELKPPPGWAAKRNGDWGMLVSPDGKAMMAFIMFDRPAESTKRLGEVATILGASGIKWGTPKSVTIGPDAFPAQMADGTCKFPSGDGEILYATVNPGVPQQVLLVAAADKTVVKAVEEQGVATIQSMRKKR